MKTLRDGERKKEEAGEVVTRDDGTVARRVRKRKRRSEQSAKDVPEKEKKSLVIKASILVGSFLLLLMAGVFMIAAKNSGSHTKKLEEKISEWTGAETKLSGVKMAPAGIGVDRAHFQWDNSRYLRSADFRLLRGDAKITSFLGAKLGGQQIGGSSGTLLIAAPVEAAKASSASKSEEPLNFQRYYCDALNVEFGGDKVLGIFRAETSLRHINGEGYRVTVGGGMLALKGWDRFSIENALMMVSADEVNLVSLRLQSPTTDSQTTNSVISLSGKIPLKLGADVQLDIETDGFPAESLMGQSVGRFFPGMIRKFEMGVVNFKVGDPNLKNIIIPFSGNFMNLESFAFLSDIELLFDDAGKGAFFFDSNIEGVYRWTPQAAGIEKFKAANDNFKVSGSVVVGAKGELRGQLDLSISLGLIKGDPELRNLPGFQNIVNEGYALVRVTLGGTVAQPKDNFKQVTGIQLVPAAGGAADVPNFDDFFNDVTGQ